MKCPNCNSSVTSDTCRRCGLDVAMYKNAELVSAALYNKGLEAAGRSDLTEATAYLSKSIEFNKRNKDARNLLGLVYFAVGKVNEALKEWVVSQFYHKENNAATGYLDIFQNNQRKMEKYSEAVSLYNQALNYALQKSEDIAIIRLKRAIEYNPHFVDALNLLALCYVKANDKTRALSCVEKALAIDKYNPVSLSYYKHIVSGGGRAAVRSSREPVKTGTASRSFASPFGTGNKEKGLFGSLPVSELICFLVGVICTLGFMYVLVIPSISEVNKGDISAVEDRLLEQQEEYENILAQKDREIFSLKENLEWIEGDYKSLDATYDIYQRTYRVSTAYIYLLENKQEDAVNYLETIRTDGLSAETMSLYQRIIDTAYPVLETKYYNKGKSSFDSGAASYPEAKTAFETSLRYAAEGSVNIPNTLFYLGRIAETEADKTAAKNYYQRIIDNYPNSGVAAQAGTRLNGLG